MTGSQYAEAPARRQPARGGDETRLSSIDAIAVINAGDHLGSGTNPGNGVGTATRGGGVPRMTPIAARLA